MPITGTPWRARMRAVCRPVMLSSATTMAGGSPTPSPRWSRLSRVDDAIGLHLFCCRRRGAGGQVAFLRLLELVRALQPEDLLDRHHLALDVHQQAILEELPRGLLHGRDGGAHLVVGPDDEGHAQLLK